MIIVSDTSPINYLVQIGEIELLPRLFGKVLIPGAVVRELTHPRAPEIVKGFVANPPAWFKVHEIDAPSNLDSGVHIGEAEAVALAKALGAAVLMDDLKGKRYAASQGVTAFGTIVVLERAAMAGWLDFEETLDKLVATNFHLSSERLASILQEYRNNS